MRNPGCNIALVAEAGSSSSDDYLSGSGSSGTDTYGGSGGAYGNPISSRQFSAGFSDNKNIAKSALWRTPTSFVCGS